MNIIRKGLSLIFPMKCIYCGNITDNNMILCGKCLKKYEKEQNETMCSVCGNNSDNCKCGDKEAKHIFLTFYKSFFDENRITEKIIHSFKYVYSKELTDFFGRDIAKKILRYIKNGNKTDLSEFVIIYPQRRNSAIEKYGFDQAKKLAASVSRYTGIKSVKCIKRIGNEEQKLLSSSQRKTNAEHSFMLINTRKLTGRKIIFIDDIYTTGSTEKAVNSLLVNKGSSVYICATIAKTISKHRICQ